MEYSIVQQFRSKKRNFKDVSEKRSVISFGPELWTILIEPNL